MHLLATLIGAPIHLLIYADLSHPLGVLVVTAQNCESDFATASFLILSQF